MKTIVNLLLMSGLIAGTPAAGLAQEGVITLDGARIRGSQESPLVLYLVPWKPPEARSLDSPDEELMLARPIKPLQRSEFQRLVSYHHYFQALKASEAKPQNAGGRPE